MKLTEQDKKHLNQFIKILGLETGNLELFKEALTHRSFLNEVRGGEIKHNERLEFLGDAVLELVTTKFLFEKYKNRPEGELTSFRAALVRTESLAEEALKLGVGKYIYMSKGEAATGGRERPYILANTFEAIIGAIYLDSGIGACRKFLKKHLLPKTDNIVENRLDVDAKSKLQEVAQELVKITPTYSLVTAKGPDHNKIFTMEVIIGEMKFGTGTGKSKQEAEQKAAEHALQNWDDLYPKHPAFAKISG